MYPYVDVFFYLEIYEIVHVQYRVIFQKEVFELPV